MATIFSSQKPTILKRGAIYHVLMHGQPKVVERERVVLATDKDVEFYLRDSRAK